MLLLLSRQKQTGWDSDLFEVKLRPLIDKTKANQRGKSLKHQHLQKKPPYTFTIREKIWDGLR